MKNWAGNHQYEAAAVHYPTTVEEVQALVAGREKVRALGSRHSFNDLADPQGGDLISLKRLNQVLALYRDGSPPTVTVGAGITYGALCPYLDQAGYALPNLASLPHISVAGACATGTHGSGNELPGLAAAVSALQLVRANGELETLSRREHGEAFDGMVVALGGLGIVSQLTLDLVEAFLLEQRVHEQLPFAAVRSCFEELTGSAYSVSLFTDWQNNTFNQVWFKSRLGEAPLDLRPWGARTAAEQRHPVQESSAEATLAKHLIDPDNCTQQGGQAGPWYQRLPHFRLEGEPSSSGEELQTEYFVPREHALDALAALFKLGPALRPLLQISEVRTIAADRLWMSPCFGRPSVGLHFTWHKDTAALQALLPQLEAALAPFQPRPHWGKLFGIDPARLRLRYPKVGDFQELLRSYDPTGKFRNRFLDRYIFAAA